MAGRGERSPCIYNPDDPTCNNSFAKYTFDLDKAKSLLKEAGKENFSFDFWYSNALPYNNVTNKPGASIRVNTFICPSELNPR